MAQVSEELIVQISAQITQLQEGMAAALATVVSSNAEMAATTAAASAEMGVSFEKTGIAAKAMGASVVESAASVKEGIEGIKSAASGMAEFVLVGMGVEAVVKGFEKFSEAGVEARHLAEQTGMTVTQISRLKFAAESSHVSAEALTTGLAKLAKTMTAAHEGNKKASDSLAHFGITAENLHDPLFSMKDAFDKIAEKTSQQGDGFLKTGEAQQVFGRGAAQLIPLLNQGADGMAALSKKSDELGTTMDGKVQHAQKAVAQSFLDMHQTMTGVRNTIMVALAPAFANLIHSFTESIKEGGFLNEMFQGIVFVIKVMVTAVETLYSVVKIVMQGIVGAVVQVADSFKGLGRVIADVVTGNFGKIKSDWAASSAEMAADSNTTAGQIKDTYSALGDSLGAIWDKAKEDKDAAEGAGNGNESTDDAKSGKAKKLKAAKDMFSEMKSQLEQLEDVEKVSDDNRLAYELNYWKAKLTTAKKGSAEYRQIFHEVAVLQREMAKKEAEEAKKAAAVKEQIIKTEAAGEIAHTKAMLAQKKAAVEGELALGQISKQEELRQLASFEKQAFDIELGALNDYIKTLTAGTAAYATALKDRQALNDSFNAQLQASNIAMAEAQSASIKAALAPVTSAIQQSVNGMIAGTTTMKQALGNIYKSILGEFVSMLAQQVAKWAAAQIAQTMAAMAGAATRVATAKVAAKATTAADRASGQSQISSAAATGAAKAYQAIVGIPYVGPILAPIAASVAFVGIEAFGSRLGSAAGGWGQVPHDQIASLHKDEMVLPADIAGPMRAMTKGGAMGGGGTTVNLQALDMRSLADALRRNPSALAGAVQHANRMGHF
jgi:hypothetical protein